MNVKYFLAVILLAIAARFVLVGQPLIDGAITRECIDAEIARNFFEEGINLQDPRLSYTHDGRYSAEAVLYPALMATLYRVTGESEPAGRVVSILFAIAVCLILFLFLKKISSIEVAIASCAAFLLIPIGIYYGRTFSRYTMAMFFAIVPFYMSSLNPGNWKFILPILSGGSLSVSLLMFPPFVTVLPAVCYLLWNGEKNKPNACILCGLFAAASMLLPAVWYSVEREGATGGGIRNFASVGHYLQVFSGDFAIGLSRMIFLDVFTPAGVVLAIFAFVKFRAELATRLSIAWLASCLLYFLADNFVIRTALNHAYYSSVLFIPASIAMGIAAPAILRELSCRKGLNLSVAAGVVIYSFCCYKSIGWRYIPHSYVMTISDAIDSHVPAGRKIVISYFNGAINHYARRSGCVTYEYHIDNTSILPATRENVHRVPLSLENYLAFHRVDGYEYLVLVRSPAFDSPTGWFDYARKNLRLIFSDPNVEIYYIG